jgi:hypothetical protein
MTESGSCHSISVFPVSQKTEVTCVWNDNQAERLHFSAFLVAKYGYVTKFWVRGCIHKVKWDIQKHYTKRTDSG